jgi:uncharacterized repeat protein (TIGR04052 family)
MGLSSLALLTFATACGGETVTPVTVELVGLVGGQPAECGRTYDGLGMAATAYTLQDFRLYVHDVRLVTEDGREVPLALEQDGRWQHEDVALLDFETGGAGCPTGTEATNTSLRGTVAEAGPFRGIRFTVGVPFELNHADASTAPPPLNSTAMFWNWQGGYKFIRVDGSTTTLASGFFLHLGSTGCDGEPLTGGTTTCANANRMEVALDGFDPLAAPIRVDVANVLAGTDLSADGGGAPGCMSGPMDPECGPIFSRLGLAFPGVTPGDQRLFTAP